jgi:hypothetical protein
VTTQPAHKQDGDEGGADESVGSCLARHLLELNAGSGE